MQFNLSYPVYSNSSWHERISLVKAGWRICVLARGNIGFGSCGLLVRAIAALGGEGVSPVSRLLLPCAADYLVPKPRIVGLVAVELALLGKSVMGGNDCPMVLACDAAYVMPLATTLRSLVEANSNSWPLSIWVMVNEFGQELRRRVLDSLPDGAAEVNWIDVDVSRFGELGLLPHVSKMTYARFLIPEILPESVDRVVYLDTDVLVLDDLSPLWETDLEEDIVGAVSDRFDPFTRLGEPGFEDVPRVRRYFNAGVLVIDLRRWREEGIAKRAAAYLAEHPRSSFSDQDALNVVCDGRWKQLDWRWNFQHHLDTRIRDLPPTERPAIVHFVTGEKPWRAEAVSLNASLYDGFRSRTRFARTLRQRLADNLRTVWPRSKQMLRHCLKRYPRLRAVLRSFGTEERRRAA